MAENQEFGPKIYYSPDDAQGGPEEQARRPGEEYFSRAREEQFAMTDPGHETLKLTTKPEAVIRIADDVLADFEDLDKKDRSITNWSMTRYYEQIAARRRALSLTREELERLGIVERVVVEGQEIKGGNGEPLLRSKIAGYGLEVKTASVPITEEERVEDVEIDRDSGQLKEGEKKIRVRRRTKTVDVQVTEFGTNTQREKLVEIHNRAEQMMIARQDLMTLYSDIYLPNTASLENIVTLPHIGRGVPKFSAAELKTLFTLPDYNEVGRRPEGGPEDRTLGNYVDLADRLFEIAAVSEFRGGNDEATRKRLQQSGLRGEGLIDLMARPGWEFVFGGMSDAEVKRWIGDVDKWVHDDQRHNGSVKEESSGDLRGLLTEFGNTWARRGKNEEAILLGRIALFIAEDYQKQHPSASVEVAKRVAKTAVRVAYYFDKVSGFFAYLGKDRYKKILVDKVAVDAPVFPTQPDEIEKLLNNPDLLKKFQAALLLEGDPKTDDLTKLYHFKEYRIKEFIKGITTGGRSAGPGVTIPGSEERLALPLMLLARSKTSRGLRSFHEQKWGYPERQVRDEKGQVLGTMPKESAKRLGELDWDISPKVDENLLSLLEKLGNEGGLDSESYAEANIWALYTLFNWLAGRKDEIKGLYDFYYAEDFDQRLFGNDLFWKGKSKFIGIVINGLLKSDGRYARLYEKFAGSDTNIEEQDRQVTRELESLAAQAYDADRKLFVHGMANLPNTKVWKAVTVDTREFAGSSRTPRTYWLLAKETAERSGFPFPEEDFSSKSK